jgi:hypothetical protein
VVFWDVCAKSDRRRKKAAVASTVIVSRGLVIN